MATISTLVVEVEAKTSKFSTGMKTAVAGLGALAVGAAYAFKQFEDADKVSRQTDAVLKSTGNSANVTADQVANLSTALSEKSGIDDEVIQSGENMLLTFKNIQNQAGAGNDIFNQASAATLDMAAGMAAASGGAVDMKSASIQLGKALNDPVAGITALTRVGVTFTEQQKKQIERMVESGDTLGAQKVILKELNSEFAGSAAAGKTSMGALSVTMGNLAESIGGVLAPAINSVLGLAITFFGWLSKYPAVLVAVAGVIAAVTVALIANNIATAFAAQEGIVYAAVLAARTAAYVAGIAVTIAATAAQWLFNAALTANPIGLVIVAIVALVAGIALLIRHFHLTDDIMNVLKKTVDVVWGFIKAYVGTVIKIVVGYVKIWIAVIGFLVKIVGSLAGIVSRAFQAAYNAVKTWVLKQADIIRNVWNGIIGFVGKLGGILARAGAKMWDWLGDLFRTQVNVVLSAWNWLIGQLNKLQVHIHLDPPGPGSIDFDWSGMNLAPVQSLQHGGVVTRTGMALVHEGERYSGVGGGWGTVNVYVEGSVQREKDLAESIQKALLRNKRRSGSLGLS